MKCSHRGAEQDLEDLYAYLAKFDSPKNADYVLERLLDIAESLNDAVVRAHFMGL
jgi:toxin ParE1/3/4